MRGEKGKEEKKRGRERQRERERERNRERKTQVRRLIKSRLVEICCGQKRTRRVRGHLRSGVMLSDGSSDLHLSSPSKPSSVPPSLQSFLHTQ